jgi:hypothetical protein
MIVPAEEVTSWHGEPSTDDRIAGKAIAVERSWTHPGTARSAIPIAGKPAR